MVKKHTYLLRVNATGKKKGTYPYRYGSTKTAFINIYKSGFDIEIISGAVIDVTAVKQNKSDIFNDAIQKAFLLFTISQSKKTQRKDIIFSIDGTIYTISPDEFPFYCLVNTTLSERIPSSWKRKKELTDAIIDYKEYYKKPMGLSAPDYRIKYRTHLMASMEALIYSKTKSNEYERFSYLWMAMNGLYNYVYYILNPNSKKRPSEVDEMECLWQWLKYENATNCHWIISNNDKPIIASNTRRILKRIDPNMPLKALKDELFAGATSAAIKSSIHTYSKTSISKPYDISVNTYLYFLFPYYHRCQYFHADKPFPLIAKADDEKLHSLKILNRLLEDFIVDNLPNWFDTKYVDSYIKASSGFGTGKNI